ncbi:MAG: aminodeoxychorismate synthase component I [Salinimicrobium sp.]
MRTSEKFKLEDIPGFKKALLEWSRQFEEVVWLDSNEYHQKYSAYDAVLAVEAFTAIKTTAVGAFERLQEYQQNTKDWIFGYLSYDLKNDVEVLSSKNHDGLHFPDLYFFQPKKLFLFKDNKVELQYLRMVDDEMPDDLKDIKDLMSQKCEKLTGFNLHLQPRISKEDYLVKVIHLLGHIQRGDIYEVNFCQEFFAEDAEIEPLQVYRELNSISNPPFAAFVRLDEHFILSASPERYLQKKGCQMISQPIKGTAARDLDPKKDRQLAKELEQDPKERSENVMIVDLVRNDLSKVAKKGSVLVEELCKIYSFEQVHQMVSTVKAEVAEGVPTVEVIKSSFPMGSMTGAPKVRAMQLVEELEESKRGVYSGAIGYFTPEEDFDFSVVIRSILYNRKEKYVSFSVGGAITTKSDPQKEFQECLVKARALRQVLENTTFSQ